MLLNEPLVKLSPGRVTLTHPDWPAHLITYSENSNQIHYSNYSDNKSLYFTSDYIEPLTSYLSSFTTSNSTLPDTGIMPAGVLNVSENVVVFERPPCYQNIQLIPSVIDNIDYDSSSTYIYRLPIPWTLYFVSYSVYNGTYYPNQIKMFFMNSSLQTADLSSALLFLPPLINFYNDSSLCNPMFDSMDELTRYDNNVSGVINAAYNWIWNTGSNLDLTMNIIEYFFQIRSDPSLYSDNPFVDCLIHPHPTTYYLDFKSISTFFHKWEAISLQDVSSITWPNPSHLRSIHTHIADIGTSKLEDWFYQNNVNPDDYLSSEEHYEQTGEMYRYNETKYYSYLRSSLSSPTSFSQAYDSFFSEAFTSNLSSPSVYKIVSDIFLSLSSL